MLSCAHCFQSIKFIFDHSFAFYRILNNSPVKLYLIFTSLLLSVIDETRAHLSATRHIEIFSSMSNERMNEHTLLHVPIRYAENNNHESIHNHGLIMSDELHMPKINSLWEEFRSQCKVNFQITKS